MCDESKNCFLCGRATTPVRDRVALSELTYYETTRWDCMYCGMQRWDSLWEEQNRQAKIPTSAL